MAGSTPVRRRQQDMAVARPAMVDSPSRLVDARSHSSGPPQWDEHDVPAFAEAARAVHQLAVELGIHGGTVVCGAWALVVARYAARPDPVFGTPARPGRSSPAGLVPCCVDLTGPPTVRRLLSLLDGQRRGHVDLASSDDGALLFDTVLRFDDGPPQPVDGTGAVVLVATARLHAAPGLVLAFDRTRLDRAVAERLGVHLVTVLGRLRTSLDCRPGDVSLLTDAEMARVRSGNAPPRPRRMRTVPEAVVAQAALCPEAPAVVTGSERLTYAELVGRAARLARHLQAQGVTPDDLVGVMLPRTVQLPVALLGILLAGGAYVPIDPSYPEERVRFILEDSAVDVVVTEGSLALGSPPEEVTLVRVDADADRIAAHDPRPPAVVVDPSNAAYVIYTSGSTGRPKGVVIEHANLAALLDWAHDAFTEEELARVAAAASICFDFSVFELFAPLTKGGSVLLFSDSLGLAASAFDVDPTMLNLVPSAMEALVQLGKAPRSVPTVNLGGEALARKLVDDVFTTAEVSRVVNVYGPTETTVCSTTTSMGRSSARYGHSETVPIGHPVANTQAWVVDDFGVLAPSGLPGELHIGGAGVGRGYVGRAGLTAERFVPDPFGGEPGARLYRTGDIVRLGADGLLEYLGRRDNQVKVRGFRIELLEVESHLLAHPQVREAAVVVVGDRPADRVLAAHVVATGGRAAVGDLEGFLRERLPAHMVPSSINVVERLPRLPNGKVDRVGLARLPAPPGEPGLPPAPAFETATERALAGIWREVLGVDDVHPGDDFFHLGGQSLLALQVAVRASELFEFELPLPRLFELRTLGAMAADIDASKRRNRRGRPLVRQGRARGPMSLQQQAVLANHDPKLVPAAPLVFRLSGTLDVPALEQALNEVVCRHEVLRTVYRSSWRRHRQQVLPWSPAPLDVVDRRSGNPRQVVVDNLVSEFDLASDPMVRWKLVKLAKHEHLLSIAVHEVAADGWSLPLLLSELSTLYGDFLAGRAPSLPEPAVQYLDFALWQRRTVTRRARRRQVAHWKRRLRDAPIALDLVPDLWPEAFDAPLARAAELLVDAELCARMEALAREDGATLFVVLMAGLQGLLHRMTGSSRVVLRPTFANRTNAEVEPVIGFFINYLLVDTDVSGDPSFRELMRRARGDVLDATQHADVPLPDVLQRVAGMKTARAQWPAGPLRFQLFNFPHDSGLSLDGLRVAPEDPGIAASDHFSLGITPNPDGSLHLLLNYDGALFGRAAMERLLARYLDVLEQVTAAPEARVSTWSLLDRRELDLVRRAGRGGGSSAEPASELVHRAVRELGRRCPEAVAVASASGRVTYGELSAWAGDVASRLRALGVTAEAPVVLFVSPGPAYVAGLLGVLEAGGLCVPVDVSLPKDVVAAVVAYARPMAAVVEGNSAGRLPGFAGPVVDADERGAAPGLAQESVLPEQAALALYAFGHGEPPRAAVVTHEGLAQVAAWHRSALNLRRADRVVELPCLRVGRVASALCATLVSGATYLFANGDGAAGPGATVCIGDGALDERASASARLLVWDEPVVAAPDSRRRARIVEHATFPETAGAWLVGERLRSADAPALRGTPGAGVDVVIVDRSTNLVPPLVPGEVLVRAPQLARGYLDDPRATALAFVPDPFSDRPGARLFRTGLMARVDGKQRIEVLGGDEGEWSARGMPLAVHLRCIEAALRAHPAVASVVARVTRTLGEPRVFAFVVPRSSERLRPRDLRGLLPEGLPPVAVPMSIKVVDRLPRRPDGRIDYRALQAK